MSTGAKLKHIYYVFYEKTSKIGEKSDTQTNLASLGKLAWNKEAERRNSYLCFWHMVYDMNSNPNALLGRTRERYYIKIPSAWMLFEVANTSQT